jgi:heme/copper-type cytochrome/quinol oxidase subunit 2
VNATGVVLVLFALVAVAVMAYRAGYVRGQDELLQWHGSTAAEQDAQGMTAVLPRWRGLTGWAAYGFAGLLNCLFLGLAFLYAKRWGWALAAWALWFALFVGVIWLAEWCWQPYREAQGRLRQKQIEILRAIEGRPNEEDQA